MAAHFSLQNETVRRSTAILRGTSVGDFAVTVWGKEGKRTRIEAVPAREETSCLAYCRASSFFQGRAIGRR